MTSISIKDVIFDPGSVADPVGRVFYYENRVFRAITKNYSDIYRDLISSEHAEELFKAGLVRTWLTDFEIDGYDLVIEHEKLSRFVYSSELSTAQLYDMAIVYMEICSLLIKKGLCLKDAQPGNFFYNKKCEPIWIDFGSVVNLSESHFPFETYRFFYLLPLLLKRLGGSEFSREINRECGLNYWYRFFVRIPFCWFPITHIYYRRLLRQKHVSVGVKTVLKRLKSKKIKPKKAFWSGYGQGGMPEITDVKAFSPKAKAVYDILKRIDLGSVLDMAGNKGWYAELVSSMGSKVVSFDRDDASISYLYERIKGNEKNILPVVMDFAKPTPPFSIALAKPSAVQRYRSDTVLVLALVHHLVFTDNMSFRSIAMTIDAYTAEQCIVEFIPHDDVYVSKWMTERHKWYTIENFIKVMYDYFRTIEIYDSDPYPRKLLLCKKA